MRIVSLLPAATEWIAAFDAAELLVGRSHACNAPAEIEGLPSVTSAVVPEADSATIDRHVREQGHAGLSLYDVDLERLRALRPDLVVTQAQCEVCAVSLEQLEASLAAWIGATPQILSLHPMTLKAVLDDALRLGRAIGRLPAAMSWLAEAERALRERHRRIGVDPKQSGKPRPTVACVEWLEPIMTAGHWMPDAVEMAGGRAVLAEKGRLSPYVDWEALREADPDVIAVLPCGFTLDQTRRDLHYLTGRDGWAGLRAVREGRVYLFDGVAYFNRPGPRLYRAIELLTAVLYPEPMSMININVAPWEMQPLDTTRAMSHRA